MGLWIVLYVHVIVGMRHFVKSEIMSVPDTVGHQAEAVAKHDEAAVGSNRLIDNGVSMSEDEVVGMPFIEIVVACKADQRIIVG